MPQGARKAAMLLTWLTPGTAAELLKDANPATVARIAAELAYLDATGQARAADAAGCVEEFFSLLRRSKKDEVRGDEYIREMVENVVGQQKAPELLGQVQEMVLARDPFLHIRSADVGYVAAALKGEGAQVVALVLNELPARKSAELLALLGEDVRTQAVQNLTVGDEVPLEARVRVAGIIMKRLSVQSRAGVVVAKKDATQQLRRVALIVRGLPKDLREATLQGLTDADKAVGEDVARLMVTWEDIPTITGRALQDSLRVIDARKLALALSGADEKIVAKIQDNISERMKNLVDEEASLLGPTKLEDVQAAREPVLQALRELNANGELAFEEDKGIG